MIVSYCMDYDSVNNKQFEPMVIEEDIIKKETKHEDDIIVIDEVAIKREIKLEDDINVIAQNENNDDEDGTFSSIKSDHDNSNLTNASIDIAKADDMGVFVKFCPVCKAQANKTQQDIDNYSSFMTCRSCSNWTYRCWDCNKVKTDVKEDSNERHTQCPHCRKISQIRRNCQKKN